MKTDSDADDRNAPVAAVLFDWDGTLVDSLPVVTEATNRVLVAHGFPALPADAVHDGMRLPTIPRMALHAALPDDEHARGLAQRMADEFYRIAVEVGQERVAFYPGVLDLIDRLAAHGVALAIVSNNRRSVLEPLIDVLGLRSRFAVVIGEEDVALPKPDPEGVLRALEALGVAPGRAIYVGDSSTDAGAAAAAGVRSIGAGWAAHATGGAALATFDLTCSVAADLARYALRRNVSE
ncbi:MAG: HAD family hydrolase [Spirochaetaceae bacterium]|nr:MAG: HAD family hydrolase [Spirochaetaceae bacterium]